jgi:hypothetical protein
MLHLLTFVVFAPLLGTSAYADARAKADAKTQSQQMFRLREIAVSFATASLGQTLLNVSVQSGGSNLIVVPPGSLVSYSVIGLLGDNDNQGLALVGFDLDLDAGPLAQADTPTGDPNSGCENPMIHFTEPWGITNPAGYGGTIIGGDLIQVGGAQNTINNTTPPSPIGSTLLGVAKPAGCGPAVLVTGSLAAPMTPGTYTLALENLFANIITSSTTGNPIWQTQAAGVGTITNLTIVVQSTAVPAASEWGLVNLLLSGLVFGTLAFGVKRRKSGSANLTPNNL